MLVPEIPLLGKAKEENHFQGLLDDMARNTLSRSGYISFTPSSDTDVAQFIGHFSGLWERVDDGFTPNPQDVKRQMDEYESILYDVWRLALRNDFASGPTPLVAQAAVTRRANPLIFRSHKLNRHIIVMASGFWDFIAGSVLGLLHWAEGSGEREVAGKNFFIASANEWIENDPSIGPGGGNWIELATIDLDITNYAVGLAEAAFTWAFLHEMGHFTLGHSPVIEETRGRSADGTATATSMVYKHEDELAADAFGFDRYLGLMPLTMELRQHIRFGPQIDHAPIVAFELIDLAYRLKSKYNLLNSSSHPPPLERAKVLMISRGSDLSEEGRDWYGYWSERLAALQVELLG
jgi:hypothetical protein